MASPEEQTASMIAAIREKTGKSLDEWVAIARASGKAKHGELVAWLKSDHGFTHGYANLVAHTALQSDASARIAAGDDLVSEMFAGDKAALRPIFDKLMAAILALGGDIEQAPMKGYLSLKRKTQFATLHPSTRTRFDVGIKLKGVAAAGRLEAAGSWNAMVTHRVRLESPDQVDAELIGWLRQAHEGAG
jgi:predicted transport protein